MLISDTRQVLFVHVPKTGGVSIEQTVEAACPDARKGEAPLGRHATLGRILKHEPQAVGHWTFGFVRNPWARMVSWYSMISQWDRRHGPSSGKPQDVFHGSMRDGNDMWRAAAAYSGFDEFVMRGTEELPRVGTPQIRYLRAPKFGREVDFIGRTENFVADLQKVQVQLGLEPSVPVHKNKSRHGTYHDYFTDETRKKIAEVYAEDIDLFGYTY
ncbi:sulfotransferase family 2 domain-containing protein [Nocardioides hwasunensis]|uniref:Sulfotransferase family 2 domain-containing protein n=1 Tax=Nocardioides hwasunensis TaxID=397258 RepID=A0ABR8MBV2_9ACTN|nr:sulfotransferase family 2 domain-containing protein [Nocardioides hwasunensis]MBD3913625.1 sulfotransferase family 2 domain-containing protein [Nocardioides hwasunensis]